MIHKLYAPVTLVFFFLLSVNSFAQGIDCNSSEPFCAGGNTLVFENNTGNPNRNKVACLYTIPNPSWFYLQISKAGDLEFIIKQNTTQNMTGRGLDVDFVAWGPFPSQTSCDDLNDCPDCHSNTIDNGYPYGNVIDCSYSGRATETMTIKDAQVGDVYLVLITNFSGDRGYISLTQTNSGDPDAGKTDCSIVFGEEYCEGETATLDAEVEDAVNYVWEYDDGDNVEEIYNGSDSSIDVADSGTYYVTITLDNGNIIENTSFEIVFNPVPEANSLETIEVCEHSLNAGEAVFDLTEQTSEVLDDQNSDDYDVSYYTNETDAEDDENKITNPDEYLSQTKTIYVRVTDTETDCYETTSFEIEVLPIPEVSTPDTIETCDEFPNDEETIFDLTQNETQIIGNQTDVEVTWYQTQTDAETPSNPIPDPRSYNATTGEVFVRVESSNGCYSVTSQNIEVLPAPEIEADLPTIEICEEEGVTDYEVDLTQIETVLLANLNPAEVEVDYFENQSDAKNNINSIDQADVKKYIINDDTEIWVRTTNENNCYSTTSFQFQLHELPEYNELETISICDDEESDGVAEFDLTDREDTIFANENNSGNYTVSYYQTQQDAQNAFNPIDVPTAFTNSSNPQTIYVAAEGANGCRSTTSFEIIVHGFPELFPPSALELCDYTNPGDKVEAFDLEEATLEITGGDTSIAITYHETQDDADSGDNPVSSPYTTPDDDNNHTLYIRVVDSDTGCSLSEGFTLTLIVNPLPSPQVPEEPLQVCDADNDGFVEFDLAKQTPIILNDEPEVSITYHLTENDAESGNDPIDTSAPFGLSSANDKTLYVRAENTGPNENDGTGCYVVEELMLAVVPTPEIGSLEDLYECDDETPDGFTSFDLTENTKNILNDQDPNEVTVTYHLTQEDAEEGENAIVAPSKYTNILNPQQIFVRLENEATQCIDTFDYTGDNSFWIEVEALPVVNAPSRLQVCDDDYRITPFSQNRFDLTEKEGEIVGTALAPNNYMFTYYASEDDYLNDTPIVQPEDYENTENPQSIYIRLIDTQTEGQCEDMTTLTIEVLPLPNPFETDLDALRLLQCDDDNDGIAAEPFDLSQTGNLISAGENMDIGYYTNEQAAQIGDDTTTAFITDPENYINNPGLNKTNANGEEVQVIYARVNSGVNGNFCYVIVPFELQVVPAPVLNLKGAPFGYVLCEDGNSGQVTINPDHIEENLYDFGNGDQHTRIPLLDEDPDSNAGQSTDLSDYTITYHESEVDAESGANAIDGSTLFSNGDQLYIRVEHTESNCYNTDAIGVIKITVDPRPTIQEVDLSEVFCSDEQGGDSVTIDLTQFYEAINPGNPADTEVVYYADMEAYDNQNPISGNLTEYSTTTIPQELVAEVIDSNTLCASSGFATIYIEVIPRPEVDLSLYNNSYLCRDLNSATPAEGGNYAHIMLETYLSETDYTFEWYHNASPLTNTGNSLTVVETGDYEVVVTDLQSGCVSRSSATILEANPPEFTVTPLSLAFEEEHALEVSNVIGDGNYEFNVNNGPWTAMEGNGSLTFSGIAAGEHLVYGRDTNGCGTTLVRINFIDYPKFFTPNEDGYNDRWNIIGLANQSEAKVYIFDRYGKLLKQLSPGGEGWDGTFNGQPIPSNDYWFRVEYIETLEDGTKVPRTFKANFTLKR